MSASPGPPASGRWAPSTPCTGPARWATIRLPVFPLPFGDYATYGDLTAADARDAWMVDSIYNSSHDLVSTIPAYWTGTTWQLLTSPA